MKNELDVIVSDFSTDENHIWFTSSFFYDIKKWYLVLSEIESFILLLNKDAFVYYQVSLNYVPIYNIQLAILCKDEQVMDEIGEQFFGCFTQFKVKNRPEKYIVEVKGIGMPYPSNTFHIGLYHIHFSKNEISKYQFQENFTQLLFSALKGDEFAVEDTHTLAVYSIIILGKAIISFNAKMANCIFLNLQNDFFEHGLSIKSMFPEEYNEISSLCNQLMSIEDIENDEPWLESWYVFCETYINENIGNFKESKDVENKIKDLYTNKIEIIGNQLGMPSETSSTLFSLVNYSLTK